jgi:uncharacterized protein
MPQIIDADGHIVEPSVVWEEYVEPAFRDRVIQIRRNREGNDEFWVNGERRRAPSDSIVAAVIPGGYLDSERTRNARWEDILPGSWDPHARIKVLDEEGIDLAFLYPSFYLIYGDHEDPRLAAAACRAYNNWMADFCRPYPKRLFGVGPMPIQDVNSAVIEMRRAIKDLNFKAVFIRPNPYNHRRLCDPVYDPFWREAQELDAPVAIHSSFGTKMPALGADRSARHLRVPHGLSSVRAAGGLYGRHMRRSAGALPATSDRFHGSWGRLGRLLARPDGRSLREDGRDGAVAKEATD